MASFFLLGLILAAIFLVTVIFLISLLSNPSNTHKRLPPGTGGWPLIGESLSFASNPGTFVQNRMKKHSPDVFQTSIAGERTAVICGPAGHKFVFSNDNKLLKPWSPPAFNQALSFGSIDHSSPSVHDHSFLKVDSIRRYVSAMDKACRAHLEKYWAPYDIVKAHPLAKDFTFALGFRSFIDGYNDDDDEQVKDLAEPFYAILQGIVSAPINFPGTPFNAAMKGGRMIKEKLIAIIKQRKLELAERPKDDQQGSDLLTNLLLTADKNGRFLSQDEIAYKIVGYLFASFVTTSTAITFVLSDLADHPHVYDNVLKEQLEITKSKEAGELLTWDDIQKMKYTWNVVCESMRLESVSLGFKEALTDLTISGFNIPKGWKVLWTAHSTNKDPKYFPCPEKFDPSRFEGHGPQPYTFVPFGGGPNMCAGKEYTRIAILAFVHNVVTRFILKKVNPNEKIIHSHVPTPVQGLPLRLQPHI